MPSTEDAEQAFLGDGEMARRMRAHDWADTPLGEPSQWPSSLQTACRICLTSSFPMVVWWGEDLFFLYNDAYRPFLGTKHPALAKAGSEVWTEIWGTIGPMLTSVLRSGQPTWSKDELLLMNRHGYWEETYWTWSFSPLHDDAGAVRGVFTVATDATQRVIGERRMALLTTLSALASGVHSVPEACERVTRALGRAGKDVPFAAVYLRRHDVDGPVLACLSPPGAEPALQPGGPGAWPVTEVLRSGQAIRVGDVANRYAPLPSGGWPSSPAEAMVLPLAGEGDGQAAGVIVLAASATRALDDSYQSFLQLVAHHTALVINSASAYQARRRKADELAEIDRAKTAFFANVSHEFRTPLALIMGPLAELRARLAGRDENVRQDLEVIHRNGLRLGKLVNALLDVSRIEAGRTRAQFEPVDLAAVTTDLASLFRPAVEKAGLRFEVDCPPLPEPVYVDRGMWEEIVLNLLGNALKFTFEGSISVSLRHQDTHAVLRVADTGIGVPAAELSRVFERFHRVPDARSRSSAGSGIGLALVREMTALHRGTITADSTEGTGTRLTIRLPLGQDHLPRSDQPAAPEHGPADPQAAPADSGRLLPGRRAAVRGTAARVLLVDENPDMRSYLQRLLAPDYEVTALAESRSALDSARGRPPDLVISNVMMPGLDGLDLVAALRADPATAEVPVLLLPARAGPESAALDGPADGAGDYLAKPFSAAELRARVREHVRLADMRRHHARWRAAVIDSLQEAFFVADGAGVIVQINPAFTSVLGFGPEGLPYAPPYPWRPRAGFRPELQRQATEAFAHLLNEGGSITAPARHRDGRPLWVEASLTSVPDPDAGWEMVAGTLRDVTDAHYARQRESALAAMGLFLSEAGSLPEAVRRTVEELHELWRARRVLAVTFSERGAPQLAAATGPATRWEDLPGEVRQKITGLAGQPLLRPADGGTGAIGITMEHPLGRLVLWIEPDPERLFTQQDRALLAMLGGYLVQALHRADQIDQQRETAIALQRAILGPAQLPADFAARYEPATQPLEVGGDWYDVIRLPAGRIGIVVGDCVGHDLGAATIMGQLRSACRALLLQNASPAEALAGLDQFAARIPGAMCSTAFCVILDPATGRFTYSSAGHPPGILAHPDGRAELLEEGRSLSLAIEPGRRRSDAEGWLRAGAVLLLYTDGLVERRRRPLTAGIAAVAAALRDGHGLPVQDLASQVMAALAPSGGYEDDVALVLYRHPATDVPRPGAAVR